MPTTLSDAHALFKILADACHDCAAKLGLITVGPTARPRPSSCEFCNPAAERFGPKLVAHRNGKPPHFPDGE